MSDWTDKDYTYMQRAIDLAKAQVGRTGSNPAVGCVIVARDDKILAEGATSDGGIIHAEEFALKILDGRAHQCRMYVTLEPCRCRSSSKKSCSALVLESGIDRVICAFEDSHPLGAGGIIFLRKNGVAVEVGLMRDTAEQLYSRWIDR